MATILIVDDDPMARFYVEQLLRADGHHPLAAAGGREALELLQRTWCDLVLMDALMPELDGYQTTRLIREWVQEERLLPVVFLTAATTDAELASCLSCGGQDFLTKPPSPVLLRARIEAWLQRAELANRLTIDRRAVENVILRMRQDDRFDGRGVRVLMTPLERTNGDLVLSAYRPDGVQHLLVGDFAGHGLVAAVGSPLVADTFYRLTREDVPLREILCQINTIINRRLPVNMFLAAAFLELDRDGGRMRIWNAVLPEVPLFRQGRVVARFPPLLPLLGIQRSVPEAAHGVVQSFLPGDRLFVFTDGILETRSPAGELFGEARLSAFLEGLPESGDALASLLPILEAFRAGARPNDDVTLVEVSAGITRG